MNTLTHTHTHSNSHTLSHSLSHLYPMALEAVWKCSQLIKFHSESFLCALFVWRLLPCRSSGSLFHSAPPPLCLSPSLRLSLQTVRSIGLHFIYCVILHNVLFGHGFVVLSSLWIWFLILCQFIYDKMTFFSLPLSHSSRFRFVVVICCALLFERTGAVCVSSSFSHLGT